METPEIKTDPTPPLPTAGLHWVRWLGIAFFLGLIVLVGMIVYNRQKRLTPEKLDAARARWQAANIRDYDLEATVEGNLSSVVRVKVRNGNVSEAIRDGRPLELDKAQSFWTVLGLFDVLQTDLDRDARPNAAQAYTRVEFDPDDGHLVQYVRQSESENQNLKIDVTIRRVR